VPGIIGKVASLLGDLNINIGSMHWGRKPGSGKAQSFIAIDQPVPEDRVEAFKKIPYVLRFTQLDFS
jgi:D-3-phosphoglycerate dehydrogenase